MIPVFVGETVGGRRQVILEGGQLGLQLRNLVKPPLDTRSCDLLDELGDLELDADGVVLETRIIHGTGRTRSRRSRTPS